MIGPWCTVSSCTPSCCRCGGLSSSLDQQCASAEKLLFLGTLDVARHRAAAWSAARAWLGLDSILKCSSRRSGSGPLARATWRNCRKWFRPTGQNRIVVRLTESRGRLPMQQLLDLRFPNLNRRGAPHFESIFGRVSIQNLRLPQLIFSEEIGPAALDGNMQTCTRWCWNHRDDIALPIMAMLPW